MVSSTTIGVGLFLIQSQTLFIVVLGLRSTVSVVTLPWHSKTFPSSAGSDHSPNISYAVNQNNNIFQNSSLGNCFSCFLCLLLSASAAAPQLDIISSSSSSGRKNYASSIYAFPECTMYSAVHRYRYLWAYVWLKACIWGLREASAALPVSYLSCASLELSI